MNNTVVCKFCTLKEAAEQLNATQDQIESLLQKGVLREYRIGSHRLFRTADVGAIVAARNRRLERQGPARTRQATRPLSAERPGGSPGGPAGNARVSRAPRATMRVSRRDVARPRSANGVRPNRGLGSRVPARTLSPARSGPLPSLPNGRMASRRGTTPRAAPPRPGMSLREWFWNGLIQDRPETIALLSGLILLALSAMVAGIYKLAAIL